MGDSPRDTISALFEIARHPKFLEPLVEVSRYDYHIWEHLKVTIENHHRREEKIPEFLRSWAVDVVAGARPRPQLKPGERRSKYVIRNGFIAAAVSHLIESHDEFSENKACQEVGRIACLEPPTVKDIFRR